MLITQNKSIIISKLFDFDKQSQPLDMHSRA